MILFSKGKVFEFGGLSYVLTLGQEKDSATTAHDNYPFQRVCSRVEAWCTS